MSTRDAASLTGLSRATQFRRRAPRVGVKVTLPLPRPAPVNALSKLERAEVTAVLNSAEFADRTPLQVFAELLAAGVYLCSTSTMYRILRANSQVTDRRRQARHPKRTVPELQADGPNQVFTWDITKLPGPVRGQYFDAYVMIDIYSRYIVGAHVHRRESGDLAVEMMKEIFNIHGKPLVIHADGGSSMTSKPVATLLSDLQILQSRSRPHVSNDNPYSEAWFKTCKYAPQFPERFVSLDQARAFMAGFVDFYNHRHRHIGIGLHTPADVHFGHANDTHAVRVATLKAAHRSRPERFGKPGTPKILDLPERVYINPPKEDETDAA